jgi:predicted 3-demethylubiquinone-9 3-methyltransferase (glyoxalase superfamily)
MQKITTFLWFDHDAEQAVKFYTSIFKNSKIGRILRFDKKAAKASGRPAGSVLTIEFDIEGQFVALNGGPQFKFNESVSFVVNCETQEELDYFGRNSPLMAVKSRSAVGSGTDSVCRGKSLQLC